MGAVGLAAEPRATVLVAEHAPLLRDLVRAGLQALELNLVTLDSGADLVATAATSRASLVVVGPTYDRAALSSAIPIMLGQGTRTLVLADGPADDAAARLLLVGASGYLLLHDTSGAEFAAAVQRIMSGASALHPDIVHAILQDWRQARDQPGIEDALPGEVRVELTTRELEVLRGLRDGLTTRLLASRLGVAEKTVESHKSKLFTKLGVRAQAHAVKVGSERGLL